jgi:hypothetical protein
LERIPERRRRLRSKARYDKSDGGSGGGLEGEDDDEEVVEKW